MFLIVGLGNPGLSYKKTRHNAGFSALDVLAEQIGVRLRTKGFSALYGEGRIGNERVILCKPQTYMNLSGDAVQQLLHFYKLDPEKLIVLYDDIDLPIGSLRIRANGSAGTHNGMRNIIKEIGTENFPRLRIGFKPEGECRIPLIDLVLSGIKQEDEQVFNSALNKGADACLDFINGEKISSLISKYNGK